MVQIIDFFAWLYFCYCFCWKKKKKFLRRREIARFDYMITKIIEQTTNNNNEIIENINKLMNSNQLLFMCFICLVSNKYLLYTNGSKTNNENRNCWI